MTAPTAQELRRLPQLFTEKRFTELESEARRLLQALPRHGGLWKALAAALSAQGRLAEALEASQRAVALQPADAEARLNLANALQAAGRLKEALAQADAVLAADDAHLQAWTTRARLLMALGDAAGAEACLRKRIALGDTARGWNDLGMLMHAHHRMPEAEAAYRAALAAQAQFAEAANNLGNTLHELDRGTESEHFFRQALQWMPGNPKILTNLGNLLKTHGRLGEAQACYRDALAQAPQLETVWNCLLMTMNNDPAVRPAEIAVEARRFGALVQSRARARVATQRKPLAGRPVRVGVVSGDLRTHPVGYFLEGWLPHVDAARMELIAYPTIARTDAVTARLQRHFAGWHPIEPLHDETAARLIDRHAVDVLIDLAGHTGHNRLGLFAWKPAPVQASWLGYFATTGVPTIDWVMADAASVPPGCEEEFVEGVWRLPRTRLCFAAPADAPPVAPGPSARGEPFTFGSFQNMAKLTPPVLAAWSRILAQVPQARLRLQMPQLRDDGTRERLARLLADAGIAVARVQMHGRAVRSAYLAAHADVDVLLDTFPFPGGTTTCEALWMGVPTLTIAGDRMIARQGAALMQAAGLGQWVVPDVEAYVARAVTLAREPAPLHALRTTLRDALPATPLFDGPSFAQDFTEAMHAMAVGRPAPSPAGGRGPG